MGLWASIRVALRALRVNRLRSALTMLGIIFGVAAVIAMLAVGAGAQARIQEQMHSLGSNVLVLLSGSVSASGVRLGLSSRPTITIDDAWAIQREVPAVLAAAPGQRGGAHVVYGNLNWATVILGVTPEFFPARQWGVLGGRTFEREDLDGAAKVALLGQTVAHNLFGSGDPVGAVIRIDKVPFTVIGLLDRKGQSLEGQDQDDIVLVPLTTARKRIIGVNRANPRSVGGITIKLHDDVDVAEAEFQIRELLRQRHRLAPGQPDDFWLRNLSEVLEAKEASSRVLTALLATVASISLLVGGIGIMNIMLVSITERTREIGLRLAVGAQPRDIRNQFLVEAVTLSVIGGLVGIVLGVIGSLVIGGFAGWRTEFHLDAILLAVGFAGAVGVFFGFYPARKASRLLPIEALRYE